MPIFGRAAGAIARGIRRAGRRRGAAAGRAAAGRSGSRGFFSSERGGDRRRGLRQDSREYEINLAASGYAGRRALGDFTAESDEDLQAFVTQLLMELRSRTPVLTGAMRGSWEVIAEKDGFAIENDQPYANWICFGGSSPHQGQIVEPSIIAATRWIE